MTNTRHPAPAARGRKPAAGGRVSWKSVAVPNEHGAWGFLVEPALLGLLVAPGGPGVLLVLGATAALMAQHPLSLALADRRRGRVYGRTQLAWTFALGYGAAALLAVLAAVAWLGRGDVLVGALLAAPLALVQLRYDARNSGRELLPELAGASAIGALASVVAMAGGWSLGPALLLWVVLVARTVPSIVYVRTRLRLEYGRPVDVRPALWLAWAALVLVVVLAALGSLPVLAVPVFVVLLLRAALGVSPSRRPTKAKFIGIREIAFGLLVVAGVAAGFALGA